MSSRKKVKVLRCAAGSVRFLIKLARPMKHPGEEQNPGEKQGFSVDGDFPSFVARWTELTRIGYQSDLDPRRWAGATMAFSARGASNLIVAPRQLPGGHLPGLHVLYRPNISRLSPALNTKQFLLCFHCSCVSSESSV